MRFTGTLTVWNDARGFGFIDPTQGGLDVFVHIKTFPAGTGRPVVGQLLSFEVITGADGRKQARAVQFLPVARTVRRRRADAPAAWTLPRRLALPAFAVVYAAVAWRWGSPWFVGVAYLCISAVAMAVYAVDKSSAESGGWRVSERTLHLLALAGGWPGALLAQQALRHKTSKPDFVRVFWLTVLTNVALFMAWHGGWLPLAGPGAVV